MDWLISVLPSVSQRVDAMLEKLKIDSLADRSPRLCRVASSSVWLGPCAGNAPADVLLDEPLSALDLSIKRSIVADLQRINQELRIPILYVTHDRSEALSLGEHLLVLEAGRVVAEGKPIDVLNQPLKESVANLDRCRESL